ncbi:MAG: glycosyltransferase family 2 protein [Nitrososphaerota archaeon]|nr:glycosyltransferase family 2 protein [Nitrososphaerota archaeon]
MVKMSIIVTSYTSERMGDIQDLLRSIRNQIEQDYELVYVTERDVNLRNAVEREALTLGLPARVIHNTGPPGLSEARNLGMISASGDVLGFVDDDVLLDKGWTKAVVGAFQRHPDTVGLTGPAYPLWVGTPIEWFPREFDWLIGCTRWFEAHSPIRVSNCWGMNMAFRRRDLLDIGGFSATSLEKSRYLRPGSGFHSDSAFKHGEMAEDVDVSLRILQASKGSLFYIPEMKVFNKVYPYRLSKHYIIARSSWVGYSRRNASRTGRSRNFATRPEDGLLVRVIRTIVNPTKNTPVSLASLKKTYGMMALSLWCVLVGYFLGPLD